MSWIRLQSSIIPFVPGQHHHHQHSTIGSEQDDGLNAGTANGTSGNIVYSDNHIPGLVQSHPVLRGNGSGRRRHRRVGGCGVELRNSGQWISYFAVNIMPRKVPFLPIEFSKHCRRALTYLSSYYQLT